MALLFVCPRCEQSLTFFYLKIGDEFKCRACGYTGTIPESAEVADIERPAPEPLQSPAPDSAARTAAEPEWPGGILPGATANSASGQVGLRKNLILGVGAVLSVWLGILAEALDTVAGPDAGPGVVVWFLVLAYAGPAVYLAFHARARFFAHGVWVGLSGWVLLCFLVAPLASDYIPSLRQARQGDPGGFGQALGFLFIFGVMTVPLLGAATAASARIRRLASRSESPASDVRTDQHSDMPESDLSSATRTPATDTEFLCPDCQQPLHLPDTSPGTSYRCFRCGFASTIALAESTEGLSPQSTLRWKLILGLAAALPPLFFLVQAACYAVLLPLEADSSVLVVPVLGAIGAYVLLALFMVRRIDDRLFMHGLLAALFGWGFVLVGLPLLLLPFAGSDPGGWGQGVALGIIPMGLVGMMTSPLLGFALQIAAGLRDGRREKRALAPTEE